MASNRRDITADVPLFPLVNPEGLIKMVGVATNIRGALEVDGNKVVLSRSHQSDGWRFLESLYDEDNRLDLWGAWKSHQAALRAARKAGQTIAAFPDRYLPSEVHRRRAGQRPNNHAWTMPDLAPIVADPEADKRPSRAAKGTPARPIDSKVDA